jgi:serine protein kinase
MTTPNIFDSYKTRFEEQKSVEMTLVEYLESCKIDKTLYASAAERLLTAIGEPVIVDTSKDERLSRIFLNRKIKTYPAFADFYGIENAIERVVAFFKHAAQGNEEARQILYLLGPVGGGKSSIAERLKELMQKEPIYTLKAFNEKRGVWEISPINESPLGLFSNKGDAQVVSDNFGIDIRYLKHIASPWAVKRLNEAGGDLTKFKVVKVYPSILNQKGITKVEPGDENNQDISSLVGKVNVREMRHYSQNDPDAYNWSGGLNVGTQGVMEFVEMFKAPIKMLHPLLTATQEGHYNGTEQFGAIPFQGIILAHSNESEWQLFRNNKTNEAFLDRVCIVKVPYCLITSEEANIYKKMMAKTENKNAPVAPGTYEMLADFSVLSRLAEVENSTLYSKLEIYDGRNLKDKDPKAKSVEEYRDAAGVNEGMTGSSTRFAFKILSNVFNYDPEEISASPITLMICLQKQIENESLSKEQEERYKNFIKEVLMPKYAENLQEDLQKAFLESYHDLGQNIFDQYIVYADNWIEHKDFRDPHTGNLFDREILNKELEMIEKAAGIANPKDFRHETVNYVLRFKANHGRNPDWTSYEKLRLVIEKKMFANTEELLPVISYSKKATSEEEKKHHGFVERMMKQGYTEKMVRIAVEWYVRYKKHA